MNSVDFSEGLVVMTVVVREMRAVHVFVVMVWTGAQVDVNNAYSAVGLVEESTEDARKVVASLQFVLQRVCMISHVPLDDVFLFTDALLNPLLLGLELTEDLNLVLNGCALVEEALGEVFEVDRHEPQIGGRVAPVLAVKSVGEGDGVGGKPQELNLASGLLKGDGETSRMADSLIVDLLDVHGQDLSDIVSVFARVRFRKRFKQTGSFPR